MSIAFLLARFAWPSTRSSSTGLFGTAAESFSCVGKRVSAQRFWSQPRPVTHTPGATVFALATTRAMISS